MTILAVAAVKKEGFTLEPSLEGRVMKLRFSGNGDLEAVPTIGPYLKLIHSEAEAHGVSSVEVDFHELYFMNSSCFKAFVTWIDRVRSMRSGRYQVMLLSDPHLHWQKRSLEALRRIAPEVVSILPYGGGS